MSVVGVPGFGVWQSKTESGDWQEFPTNLVVDLESAFMLKKTEHTFTLSHNNAGFREGDPNQLHYKIDFASMTQICVEDPDRKRFIRRYQFRDVNLSGVEQIAIKYAENLAYQDCGDKLTELEKRMERLTGKSTAFAELDHWMRHEAPIMVQVKLGQRDDGTYMVDAFMGDSDKMYRNMFELASGAGRGSTDQGARKSWERRMFGKAFDDDAKTVERPKYGCLNITNDPKGVPLATQYGSSYLVLRNSVRWRCTFTSCDSCADDSRPATSRQFAKFLADGCMGTSDDELIKIWQHKGETVDDYREVQIHGPLRFNKDVAKLVVDKDLQEVVKDKCRRWGKRDGFEVVFQAMHAHRKGGSGSTSNM